MSVLYAINHRKDEAKRLLIQFQKLALSTGSFATFETLSVEDREDIIVSQLELDFVDTMVSSIGIGAEELDKRLKFY